MAFQYISTSHPNEEKGEGTYVTIVFRHVAGARSGDGKKLHVVNVRYCIDICASQPTFSKP